MTTSSAASQRAALIERFAAPGQPFEMGEWTVRGVPMRVHTTGPLTLRDIALASTGAADRPFLICRDERWSYAEQARIIAGLARRLAGEYGLRKGGRVAVCMRNYPEWTLVVRAAQVTGLVLVPLNAWWTVAELRYALADALVSLAVADAERAALGHVVDRMKDVVIRGGENIYCAEVEAALSEHPAIVVPRDGARMAAPDVQRHVAGRLASFKVAAHVVFRSAPLPRTQSGRVLKRDLRSAIASELRDG